MFHTMTFIGDINLTPALMPKDSAGATRELSQLRINTTGQRKLPKSSQLICSHESPRASDRMYLLMLIMIFEPDALFLEIKEEQQVTS